MECSNSLLRHFEIQMLLKINCCMAACSAFRVMQHSQIFHFSLEIEFNAFRFINYTIPRLCSTYAVTTLVLNIFYRNLKKKETAVILKRIDKLPQNLARVHNLLGAFKRNHKNFKFFYSTYCFHCFLLFLYCPRFVLTLILH